jgi:ribosomal protein S27AE
MSILISFFEMEIKMTERVNCGKCGFTLYWGESIKDRFSMRYPLETWLAKYGNKCPNCGAKLSKKTVKETMED